MTPSFATVHAPLAYWAGRNPHALAVADETGCLDFTALTRRVTAYAATLHQTHSPTICWVDDVPGPVAQLVSFLGIVSADRTAAVGDADWPPAVRSQLMTRVAEGAGVTATPAPSAAASPFYVGFTSGSSGLPKGFRRSHGSWITSFELCREAFGPGVAETMLVPGRLSHSTFLFGALLGLWSGAGVRLQSRFSPGAALDTLARGDAGAMVAVPSQLMLMLELAHRRKLSPMPGLRLLMIGGAPWNRTLTPALHQLFPQARIIEFYGASETSFIAWTDSDSTLPDHVVGRPFRRVELRIDAPTPHAPGLIYVRSPMVFTDYVALRQQDDQPALLRDGDWLSVRDIGHLDEHGRLHLLGRQQRMLLTQGKNLFPEEVENALCAHPAVAAASVQGIPDAVRGVQVTALLRLQQTVSADDLNAWVRERLEPYKIPRRYFACDDWPLTPGGKTDHQLLAQWLNVPALPTLRPL